MKYGDVLLLQVPQIGLVSGGGDVDTGLYVQRLKKPSVPPNIEDCRFRVCNKHQYACRRNFASEMLRSGSSPQGTLPSELNRKRAARDNEASRNEIEFRRLIGSPVILGNTIQLQHVLSGMFLTVVKSRAVRADWSTAVKPVAVTGGIPSKRS
jgi:hypothetical protein